MSEEISMVETRWVKPLEEVMAAGYRLIEAELPRQAFSPEREFIGAPPTEKPFVEDRNFFKAKSIAELAQEQGVGPVKDIRVFAGVIPKDEDVDEMIKVIYRLREP